MKHNARIAPALSMMVLALGCSSPKQDNMSGSMAAGSGGSPGGMTTGSGGSGSGMHAGSGGSSTSSGMNSGSGGSSMSGMNSGSGGSSSGMNSGSGGKGGGNAGDGGGAGGGAPSSIACSAPVPSAKPGNACKGSMPPGIKLTMISSALVGPTFVTQAPGDPSRLYVLEQQGTIRVIKDGTMNPAPLLDLQMLTGDAMVNATGVATIYAEAGLLGMAFDPDFENTHRFWLSYNKGSGFTTSILEYTMSDPDTVDVTKGTELLTVPQVDFNHKGGMIAFGPDGCLYIGMGDGGMEGDPTMTGQGTSDELSVMLRVDVDKYPMAAPGNLKDNIWSTGLRNPWRFSFDRMTGDLYMGDVGQDAGSGFEEVDVEPKGTGGRNYGWSLQEGSMCHSGQDCSGMTVPAFDYPITGTENSVIGGYVYRGKAMPEMVGRYIFADWTARVIKTFIYKGETNGTPEICDQFDTSVTVNEKVRAFGEDLDGEIYLVSGGTGTGTNGASPTTPGVLYKIEPQ